jgi:diguanylate cyclase (GGDEF)-like protein
MTQLPPNSIEDRLFVLRSRWEQYVAHGQFDQFIEFTVAINSLAEYFNRLRLSGLVRLCEGLENTALNQLGDEASHPLAQPHILSLQRQIDTLFGSVQTSRPVSVERRAHEPVAVAPEIDWIKPRSVWIVAAREKRHIAETLKGQLQFFGFKVFELDWDAESGPQDMPLAVLFIPADATAGPPEIACIAKMRTRCPASQLIYLGEQCSIEPIVELMRAGIDCTMPAGEQSSMVLNSIFDLVKTDEQEKYRVLVVEDSRVATAVIQRTLAQHGIDTKAINEPANLLGALESYRPDLILMDMYMPHFNGVEATRVLRQMPAYSSLPIVYLSGESAVAMQVEALRLGGDQFLSKPFNPVLLAAVVKSKIERHRETQRSTRLDGLTGLLNHTAAKSRLKTMVGQVAQYSGLTVAMIDIDHFKSINDTYGHPIGDQVIRGLAWLLKARLRSIDLIGRYGGEEFLIALPNATPEQARTVIDRIRSDFAALPHVHAGGSLHANFSAGMASYPSFDREVDLIEAADRALLQAKRMGRNRVERAAEQ